MSPIENLEDIPKIRYIRLQQVFDRALKQSLVKFQNWSKFSACFPNYAQTTEGKLHLLNCQKQITEYWTQLSKREFDEIMQERSVKEKLDKLDELIHLAEKKYNGELENEEEMVGNDRNPNKAINESNEIPLNELTTDRLLTCNAHTQRVKQLRELDIRFNKVLHMNKTLEDEIKELEKRVNNDLQDTQAMYKEFLGESITSAPDNGLTQSLNNMIVQELDYFKQ